MSNPDSSAAATEAYREWLQDWEAQGYHGGPPPGVVSQREIWLAAWLACLSHQHEEAEKRAWRTEKVREEYRELQGRREPREIPEGY